MKSPKNFSTLTISIFANFSNQMINPCLVIYKTTTVFSFLNKDKVSTKMPAIPYTFATKSST